MRSGEKHQKKPHPLSVMAHDIKAPLTAIVDLLTVIDKGYVTDIEESRILVSRALGKAIELVKMVDDILDYTLLGNRNNIKLENLDLSQIIAESINTHEKIAERKNVTLRKPDDGNPRFYVFGNRTFLFRAINNIIMNAIKYNRDGGEVTVSIHPHHLEKKVKIIVKDTGIGIDKEDIKYVFDIFQRGKNARKNIDGSIGLGLALVKQIITGHNGTIDIQSKAGCGTQVTVTLPLSGGENEQNNFSR